MYPIPLVLQYLLTGSSLSGEESEDIAGRLAHNVRGKECDPLQNAAIGGVDAVVNLIGGGTLRKNDAASATSAVAVAAAKEIGINRYIAMSAGMVALDLALFKYILRPLIFRHILAEHRRVEEIVKPSSLAWTIVRPTALTNRPAAGYVASLKLQPKAFVSARADVAAFIADELDNNGYVRQAVFVTSRHKHGKDN
jgi:uncharacterized protein YbjT (DUF2867 family)